MEWDDDADDGPASPLLPPEDRLWRHPSEIGTNEPPRSRPVGRAPQQPRLVTMVAITSALSIMLTLATVAVVRPIRTKVAEVQVAPSSSDGGRSTTGVSDVAGIAERLAAAVPMVQADGPAGAQRGSGVVYRSDGMLLTSHSVVDGAKAVRVFMHDGRELTARLVGSDPETDIALLDIDGEQFAVAPLGSAAALRVGQQAIMIGTPDSGVGGPVVSVGVVSAKGRSVDGGEGVQLLDMIQTDAEVAPGCSGGAVVNGDGVVIGIATSIVDGGQGYATPIDVARVVAAQLLNDGRVTRAWLGVEGDDAVGGGGALVRAVKSASPAGAAGITPADVIAQVDGNTVRSMTDLVVSLRMRKPGDVVSLHVVRDGEERVVKVTLASRPA